MTAPPSDPQLLADRIDAWLPQTQCGQCGFAGCRPYAEAVAQGDADINRCPPGGVTTVRALARLLGTAARPLDPACGPYPGRRLAVIQESLCIGCRKCADVCPVDAILGAAKLMHTVIAPECTGCALCVPVCPVDCIELVTVPARSGGPWPDYDGTETVHWRRRAQERRQRLSSSKRARPSSRTTPDREAIKAEIHAAVERAQARRQRFSRSG